MNQSKIHKRFRFPAEIIQYAVWLYHRFNLSHRDIEDLLAERGICVSFEAIRLWCNRFGPKYAASVAVEALIQGNIDAFAVGSSHLINIRAKFPGAGLRVAGRGPDLPNDVLVAGAHVPSSEVDRIRKAFVENAEMLMAAAIKGEENKKYIGGAFIPNVSDADYEYVRQAYITVGAANLAKFIDE